jgi:hypothetical protein
MTLRHKPRVGNDAFRVAAGQVEVSELGQLVLDKVSTRRGQPGRAN